MSEQNLPAPFLDLPETSQDIVDVARTHAGMSVELLKNYDNWCKVTLGRYAVESVSLEDLQKEYDESVAIKNFVLQSVGRLPTTQNGKYKTADKLVADKLVHSLVRTGKGYPYEDDDSEDVAYLIGLNNTNVYLAKPFDGDNIRSFAYGAEAKIYQIAKANVKDSALRKLTKEFKQLVDVDTTELTLSDDDIRSMYDPRLKALTIHKDTPQLPILGKDTKLWAHQALNELSGKTMNSANIFARLLLLSVRFGVYDQHIQLLDNLSKKIMDIRETPSEQREQMQVNIKQMFAVAEEHRQTHSVETSEAGKRRGLFGRRTKKDV